MTFRKRLAHVGACLALVFTLGAYAVPAVSAHDSDGTPDHYYGNCADGTTADRGATIRRPTSLYGKIRGVRAKAIARALGPCNTSDIPGNKGKALSGIITLEGNLTGGYRNEMQMGFYKHSGDAWGTTCQGFSGTFQPDQTYFFWTGTTQPTGGSICPASWFDGWNAPQAGTTYVLTIDKGTLFGQAAWVYCITDTSNVYDDACIAQKANGNVSGGVTGTAWWGCELGNTASALGTTQGNNYTQRNSELAYKKSSDNTWYYTEDSAAAGMIDTQPWGYSFPGYYNFNTDQIGTGERYWCNTDSH